MSQAADGTIISSLISKLDSSIEGFVRKGYDAIAGDHQGAIMLLVVLYFIFLGYGMLSGKTEMTGKDFLKHCLLVSVSYFLAVNWDIFSMLIYNFTTAIPDGISRSIISATGDNKSAVFLLDEMYKGGSELSSSLYSGMNLTNIGAGFLALIVYVTTIVTVGYATLVICVSKMTMAVALTLAPAVAILYMFNGSRFIFDGWMKVLVTSIVSIIIIYTIVALTYTIMADYMLAIIHKEHASFSDCGEYILFSFVTIGLYMSSTGIASSIGGGFASHVGAPAAMALGAAGAAFSFGKNAGGAIGGAAAKGVARGGLALAHKIRDKLRK
ncbi:MAG: type IV secretion system protein [Gammaproteobacteria bacterium]